MTTPDAKPERSNHRPGQLAMGVGALIVAAVLPFGAGFWALVDRRRSANLVLLVVHVSVAVMVYRMLVIWG